MVINLFASNQLRAFLNKGLYTYSNINFRIKWAYRLELVVMSYERMNIVILGCKDINSNIHKAGHIYNSWLNTLLPIFVDQWRHSVVRDIWPITLTHAMYVCQYLWLHDWNVWFSLSLVSVGSELSGQLSTGQRSTWWDHTHYTDIFTIIILLPRNIDKN